MNLKDIIYKRKSTRKYMDKEVEKEVITKVPWRCQMTGPPSSETPISKRNFVSKTHL